MRRRIKSLLIISATVLVLTGLYCALILPVNGSIIYKAVFTARVREYVSNTYGTGLTVEHTGYNWKNDSYVCRVKSAESADTHFSVYDAGNGRVTDTYAFDVEQRENTLWRLSREMDILMAQEFIPRYPRECVNYICGFQQELLDSLAREKRAGIALDMDLDMHEPPLPTEITLWVVCEEPSNEALISCIIEAADTAEKLGWSIDYFSVVLHSVCLDADEKPINTATEFCASCVPYDAIGSEKLYEYLNA